MKRSMSSRELTRTRELLVEVGTKEEMYNYLDEQLNRFRFIENQLVESESVVRRTYLIGKTRSPSLKRKNHSENSVDITLNQLMNYLHIQPTNRILTLFDEFRTAILPFCDTQQRHVLDMIGGKLNRKGISSADEQIALLEVNSSDVESMIVKMGKLRRDAETIVTPLLENWFSKEREDNFLRENTELRQLLRVFLRHLVVKKPQHTTSESFLCAIPKFCDRLKEFLNSLQRLAERYELENPEQRGTKLVITIVHCHFIPQLPIFEQRAAAQSLIHHIDTKSNAFSKAVSIFTWR